MYDNQEEPSEDNSPDAAGVSVPRPVPRKRLVYSSLFQDYMHRGTHPLLSGMPLYVYAMHVTRLEMMTNVLNESTEARFDRHHTAYVTHKQKIRNCVKIRKCRVGRHRVRTLSPNGLLCTCLYCSSG